MIKAAAYPTPLPTKRPAPVQHPMHIGLCILTGLLWLPVYACILISYQMKCNEFANDYRQAKANHRAYMDLPIPPVGEESKARGCTPEQWEEAILASRQKYCDDPMAYQKEFGNG